VHSIIGGLYSKPPLPQQSVRENKVDLALGEWDGVRGTAIDTSKHFRPILQPLILIFSPQRPVLWNQFSIVGRRDKFSVPPSIGCNRTQLASVPNAANAWFLKMPQRSPRTQRQEMEDGNSSSTFSQWPLSPLWLMLHYRH